MDKDMIVARIAAIAAFAALCIVAYTPAPAPTPKCGQHTLHYTANGQPATASIQLCN